MNIEQEQRLQRMRQVASAMDSQFKVLGVRFGLDPIIGLVPGAGDTVSALISMYIAWQAYLLGVAPRVIGLMIAYVFLDLLVGAVPAIGDIIDVGIKANRRNVALAENYLTLTAVTVADQPG